MIRQRGYLDELLGPQRNSGPTTELFSGLQFFDDKVCKSYIVCSYCPYDILRTTKKNIGICSLLHDDKFRQSWKECTNKEDYNFEKDILKLFEGIIFDLNKDIKKRVTRLEETCGLDIPANNDIKNQILTLFEDMKELEERMNKHLNNNEIDLADDYNKKIGAIKNRLNDIVLRATNGVSRSYRLVKKSVCLECGAFQYDNRDDAKIQAHLTGKQHTAFLKIKSSIEELKLAISQRENIGKEEAVDDSFETSENLSKKDVLQMLGKKKRPTTIIQEYDENGVLKDVEYIRKKDAGPRIRKEYLQILKKEENRTNRSRSRSRGRYHCVDKERERYRSRSSSSSRYTSRRKSRKSKSRSRSNTRRSHDRSSNSKSRRKSNRSRSKSKRKRSRGRSCSRDKNKRRKSCSKSRSRSGSRDNKSSRRSNREKNDKKKRRRSRSKERRSKSRERRSKKGKGAERKS